MSDYCTASQVYGSMSLKGYLPEATDAEAQAQLAEIITRCSRRIDDYVTDNRVSDFFAPSPAGATEKVIRGRGDSFLLLPEFVSGSVSGVTAPTGYAVPDFVEDDFALLIVDGDGVRDKRCVWLTGVPYAVTARWGFAAIPSSITEACLQLVVRTFRGQDEGFSGVIGAVNKDGSIIERAIPAPVREILDTYRNAFRSRRFQLV